MLLLLASRERIWAASRATTVATLLLVSLLLLVTIVHIDKFHTDSSSALTLAGTWAFVAAYIVLPIGLMVPLAHQLRQPGDDPPRSSRLPAWARATIVVHGGVLLVVGALLLAAPATTRGVWPWMLTPLMGRAVGAWLLAVGVALALALREDDWWRLRGPLVGYGALAILQFVALARYSGTPDWGTPQSWIFVAFLASMILFAVAGYLEARRVRTPGGTSTGPRERVLRIDNDR